MLTPNELTTIIAQRLGKELDLPFKMLLADYAMTWWARLVANTLDRHPEQRQHYSMPILVSMKHGDGYSISISPMPVAMDLSAFIYDYVGTQDGKISFDFAPAGAATYLTSERYAKRIPTYNLIGGKLYIDKQGYDKVLVKAVWENPMQAIQCLNKQCDVWNEKLPIQDKLLQQIIDYVAQQYQGERESTAPASKIEVPTADAPGNNTRSV